MGQFCRAQHLVWKEIPTEANHQGKAPLLTNSTLLSFLQEIHNWAVLLSASNTSVLSAFLLVSTPFELASSLLYVSSPSTSLTEVAGCGASLLCGKRSNRARAPGSDGHPGNNEQRHEVLQGGGFQEPCTPKGDQPCHPWRAQEEGENTDNHPTAALFTSH